MKKWDKVNYTKPEQSQVRTVIAYLYKQKYDTKSPQSKAQSKELKLKFFGGANLC